MSQWDAFLTKPKQAEPQTASSLVKTLNLDIEKVKAKAEVQKPAESKKNEFAVTMEDMDEFSSSFKEKSEASHGDQLIALLGGFCDC